MTNSGRTRELEIPVYLGLGSNIGDRQANLREALARIEKLGLKTASQSSVYETEPVGLRDQPWYLNQVVEVRVSVDLNSEGGPFSTEPETVGTIKAAAVLSDLLNIEREMGRQRTIANGPRVIDIDLLLFGNMIINRSKDDERESSINRTDVVVPHPRMHRRRFVLEPLCEIAPELVHPVLRKTCREMLASLDDPAVVRAYDKLVD